MSFNDNVRLDTSQVRSGGGGGGPGGLAVGGGIGGLILLVIAMIFGINPADLPTGGTSTDQGQVQPAGEEDGAAFIRKHVTKPVVGFIAGVTAPPGKRMGHAGAIISGGKGTADAKLAALREAGVTIAETPSDLGSTMARVLGSKARA